MVDKIIEQKTSVSGIGVVRWIRWMSEISRENGIKIEYERWNICVSVSIMDKMRHNRLRWFGYFMMGEIESSKNGYENNAEKIRGRGRPTKR